MSKQQAGRKSGLAVLAPEAQNCPARANRVVIDALDFALLPIIELKLLPDVLSFRDETDRLNKGNNISGADPSTTLRPLPGLSHEPRFPTAAPWRYDRLRSQKSWRSSGTSASGAGTGTADSQPSLYRGELGQALPRV